MEEGWKLRQAVKDGAKADLETGGKTALETGQEHGTVTARALGGGILAERRKDSALADCS